MLAMNTESVQNQDTIQNIQSVENPSEKPNEKLAQTTNHPAILPGYPEPIWHGDKPGCPNPDCKDRPPFNNMSGYYMHQGRAHLKTIPNAASASLKKAAAKKKTNEAKTSWYERNRKTVLAQKKAQRDAAKKVKTRLSNEEISKITEFLRGHANEYPNNTEALKASLEANGLTGRLKPTSSAVWRYANLAKTSRNSNHVETERATTAPKQSETLKSQTVTTQVVIKCCPLCGCHLDDVAKGLAQGMIERGEKL